MKTPLSFTVLTVVTVLLICCGQCLADAKFFDGNWEGLAIAGGVGYAVSPVENRGSVNGFTTIGRIGYGLSDRFMLFLSSSIPTIAPTVGFLYAPNRHVPYYFQGALGYESSGEDRLMSLSGGIGYEVREHVALELSLGFNRFTETYSSFIISTGETVKNTSNTNSITLAAIIKFFMY